MPTTPPFVAARPVWPAGRETEMNAFIGLRAVLHANDLDTVVRIAANSLYRLYVNGRIVGYGPVRCAHGHFRVDEWSIELRNPQNVIAIEVAGYNVNSFYTLAQPSFVQAEIQADTLILASTSPGPNPFTFIDLPQRLRKVERHGFQRTFSEAYRLDAKSHAWRTDPAAAFTAIPVVEQPAAPLHPRRLAFPHFEVHPPTQILARATLKAVKNDHPAHLWVDNSKPSYLGYPRKDLDVITSAELQQFQTDLSPAKAPYTSDKPITLDTNQAVVLDFGRNLSGFVGATVTCTQKTHLYFTFAELLTEKGDVNFARLNCVDAVNYTLEPGTYNLESFEPYTMRYLKLLCTEGSCQVTDIHHREYASPFGTGATFTSSDPRLDTIFTAAVQTFRQNAADLFTDCPSRERAGWLCDSFFTSRVALDLTGRTVDEQNFIENFLLPDSFAHIPAGMLPMCYPADHFDGSFIPQWAMWLVLQTHEYLARSNDRALVDALRPRFEGLIGYFDKFTNKDGLLEDLQGWKFIEWSKANDFVNGVHYPTNMLFAATLKAAGDMYSRPDLTARGEKILATVRDQSFDGDFFVDQATRDNGTLKRTTNRSEVCQYFAFFFQAATPESHAKLWTTLTTDFGPQRKTTKKFPEIHPANAFVGNFLRLELLSRNGRQKQLAAELPGYFEKMADTTGTLWENDTPSASCDHGFASHVAHWLYRDMLGVRIDSFAKTVTLGFIDTGLTRCEGTLMSADGPVHLRWERQDKQLFYDAVLPPGFTLKLDMPPGLEAVQRLSL